jgi:hypothetical protein
MAPDQRYCLACGARRGAPRVPVSDPAAEPAAAPPPQQGGRPADVSPLAAVIGIALLGGMLLIGVLIGRGNADDNQQPIVQVGTGSTTATSTSDLGDGQGGSGSDITSEWPAGTNGYTVQISSLPKAGATPASVDAAKQSALTSGASAASVLDSDLYPSLPPGNYILYSGVYDSSKEADAGLEQLGDGFPDASVIHVSTKASGGGSSIPQAGDTTTTPDLGGVNGETTIPSDPALVPGADTGGVTESEK